MRRLILFLFVLFVSNMRIIAQTWVIEKTDGSSVYHTASTVASIRVIPSVTEISLNESSLALKCGQMSQLKVTVTPAEAAEIELCWSSSDNNVATVNPDGLVTAVAGGTAIITCSVADGSNMNATCLITVTQPVDNITLNYTSLTLKKHNYLKLKATITPDSVSNKELIWLSNDESVAEVTHSGGVVAIAVGTCVISCMAADSSGVSATCDLTVIPEQKDDSISQVSVSVDSIIGTPSATATYIDGTIYFSFSGLKGETGPQGPQGETGPQGPQGEIGPQGNSGVASADGIVSITDFSTNIPDDNTTQVYVAGAKATQVIKKKTDVLQNPVENSVFIGNKHTGWNVKNTNSRSVFIGADNGMYMTDKPNFNTGVGYHACWAVIDGGNNTAVGAEALDRNTNGNENTAVGVWAAGGLTSSGEEQRHAFSCNTAVGAYALQQIAANGNTSVGRQSSFNLKNGTNNTAIGMQALERNISGCSNICIGSYAGRYALGNNELYISPLPYTSNEFEISKSLVYGKFDAYPKQQIIRINAGMIIFPYLPPNDPKVEGQLWNDNGFLRISSGL